ncbi:hypothetical protein HPB51_005254 [Rhipicephalus microplus]|uniref:Uncharacterized protein n=1 Tax=Rhipicephalus microplus TaxID=6941 RepID=A0A9J6E081_RHIMP|nr:hypothetical protein HPB51_005254 [Rhipicephalus microplus]
MKLSAAENWFFSLPQNAAVLTSLERVAAQTTITLPLGKSELAASSRLPLPPSQAEPHSLTLRMRQSNRHHSGSCWCQLSYPRPIAMTSREQETEQKATPKPSEAGQHHLEKQKAPAPPSPKWLRHQAQITARTTRRQSHPTSVSREHTTGQEQLRMPRSGFRNDSGLYRKYFL